MKSTKAEVVDSPASPKTRPKKLRKFTVYDVLKLMRFTPQYTYAILCSYKMNYIYKATYG